MQRLRSALPDDPAFWRSILVMLLCTTLVIGLDQSTKSWALNELDDRVIHVFGSLQLALVFNTGMAFGLGEGAMPILVVLALIAMIAVMRGVRSDMTLLAQIGMGLMLGGALSNIFDRLLRGHGRSVVDFIDFQFWPVFNFADVGIVVGAFCLVVWSFTRPDSSRRPT